ncbi:MAG TPA: hypothetical protein VMT17_12855 [Anaeromyxobacteraceae bacterium]|nr:hypothetical protein [Anaeromyxobacteraceae bacterium]
MVGTDLTTTAASRRTWAALAWACAIGAVVVALHAYLGAPFDADTAYHVAVGWLLREHGILRAFPWTPFSWLADHYADKELFFHLLLAATHGLSWTAAAHLVGALCGAAALLAFFFVLRTERVPLAGGWALLPLAASPVFVYRFTIVRPHVLSVALAPLVLWAASRQRLVLLFVASAAYPWAYVAWQMPIGLVAAAEAARWLSGERPGWKPVVVALAGIFLGVAVHPNSLNLVRLAWFVVGDVLLRNAWAGRPGFELGREFEPFTVIQWARWLLAPLAMAGAASLLAWRHRRSRATATAFAIASLAYGAATVRTARFAEYFVPFSALALALAWRPRPRWALAAFLACAIYSARPTVSMLAGLHEETERIPGALASLLRERIPPGAQIFTCDWGHTGELLLALPDRRFIVALDPTFFYAKDPERYRLWYRLPREAPPMAAEIIRREFGARFVICRWDDRFRRFLNRLATEGGANTISIADDWSVYDLGDPRSP